MSSNTSLQAILRRHPASKVRSPDGVLPFAEDDPHPGLTIALYALWSSLREFVFLSGQGAPGIVAQDPPQTPLDILTALKPVLVSLPILLSKNG